MDEKQKQRHIAYHEAGHAVMAVIMGREVLAVSLTNPQTVLNTERLRAILEATDPLVMEDQEYCEQELKIALAGWGGEVIGLGRASPLTAYDDDFSQVNVVHRALRQRAGRKGTGSGLRDDVLHTLEQNRDTLARVAEVLLDERELPAKRVQELVRKGAISGGGDRGRAPPSS